MDFDTPPDWATQALLTHLYESAGVGAGVGAGAASPPPPESATAAIAAILSFRCPNALPELLGALVGRGVICCSRLELKGRALLMLLPWLGLC